MKVALLGLGVMGRGMALRLCATGHEVSVYHKGRKEPLETSVAPVLSGG